MSNYFCFHRVFTVVEMITDNMIIRDARSKFRKSGIFNWESGFYQDIFFSKTERKSGLFSEVQEIFISLLKDKMAMFFLCIKENWTLRKQHNAFVGSLLHSRKNTEKRGFDYHYFLSCDS